MSQINKNREVILPKLTKWQQEAFDIINGQKGSGKTFVIKSGRQRGKNFLINILLITYSLENAGGVSILIEPTISQCGRVFNQLKYALDGLNLLRSSNGTTLTITFHNGSQIIFKSAEQKEALRGLTCSNILIFDEAAFISDDIIEILLPLVNVNKAPVLYTSTPLFTEGYFYRMYARGEDGRVSKTVSFDWSLDKYDMSNYLPPEQLAFYKENYSEMKYKTEILGEFISDNSYVFGDYRSCIGKANIKECSYVGIDWATGTGEDSTVVTMMNEEGEVISIWAKNNMSPTAQIKEVAKMINKCGSIKKVYVEMNSIGTVYYDMLQTELKNKMILTPFQTSNQSKRKIIEQLATAFQNKEITIPDDNILHKQLSCFVVKKLKNGGYTYENFSSHIHDDYVMSLAMCYEAFKKGDTQTITFGFQ